MREGAKGALPGCSLFLLIILAKLKLELKTAEYAKLFIGICLGGYARQVPYKINPQHFKNIIYTQSKFCVVGTIERFKLWCIVI